jgi:hypothetical protein
VLSSVLDSLFGHLGRKRTIMVGLVLRGASVLAWKHRHPVVRLAHVVNVLVDIVDVERATEARGVVTADVQAVLAQLLDDMPRWDAEGPETEPKFDPRLDALTTAAKVNGVMSTARFVDAIAAALPPELGFLRRPLAACAAELGETFDASVSSTKDGGLTFEAWDHELKLCMGLMQHMADGRWKTWQLGVTQAYLALLTYKPYFAHFKARGVDPAILIRELGESYATPTWPVRDRPEGLVATVGPALFAAILRAERYAAADATNVRLRDLLLALHDEPSLATSIDKLVG